MIFFPPLFPPLVDLIHPVVTASEIAMGTWFSLMPAEFGCFRAGHKKSRHIMERGAVLHCTAAFMNWIRPLEELTFLLLGHHSIYSKPWQWYTTQAVCKPYDLKINY